MMKRQLNASSCSLLSCTHPSGIAIATLLMTAVLSIANAADPVPAAVAAAAVATAEPAANLPSFTRWVIAADYSRDGAVLVTAGGESLLYRPGDVVVWKGVAGDRSGELTGHGTAVWAVKISKDGKLAATAGYDGTVKLWDLPGRALKNDLKRQGDPKKNGGWVRSLDFSPDGTKLVTASEDGSVVMWDTANGNELKVIAAHAGPVTSVAFAPDGTTFATGGGDKLVKLWDVAAGTEKGKLEGHTDALWVVVYSPDGSTLATAGSDRTIKLWTTSDSKEIATLASHKDWVTSAAFSPDGKRLATGSLDGIVKLWDVATKAEQVGPEAAAASVWCVAFAPDGKTLFVGSHAGGRLLPTPAPKLAPPPPPPPPPPPTPPPTLPPPTDPATTDPATTPVPVAAANLKWTTLVPTSFTSVAGASGAIAADGTIMVTGNLTKDSYSIKAVVPAGAGPQAFKLEAIPDPSLPNQGPGRSSSGNFVVSKFVVMFGPPGATETPTALKFSAAKADFEQSGYGVAGAIDDNPDTGWAIDGAIGKEHAATFEIPTDVKVAANSPIVMSIDQLYADGKHAIGKFKLSILHVPEEPKK